MTPTEQIVYDMIADAAAQGLRCPTNQQFANAVGAEALSVGARLFKDLLDAGHIRSNIATHQRIVTIVATGAMTAPPPPPKKRPKIMTGLVVGSDKRRERSDEPRTLTSEQRMERVKGGPPVVKDRIEIDVVGRPPNCQYPFGDGPFRFCGAPTVAKSYCARHMAVAYRVE